MPAFKCRLHRKPSLNHQFSKHCSCHLQSEFVVGQVLEVLYRASCRWQVRFHGPDWWNNGVGCHPMGEDHEKKLFMSTWWGKVMTWFLVADGIRGGFLLTEHPPPPQMLMISSCNNSTEPFSVNSERNQIFVPPSNFIRKRLTSRINAVTHFKIQQTATIGKLNG
jgi:hypothetical protein